MTVFDLLVMNLLAGCFLALCIVLGYFGLQKDSKDLEQVCSVLVLPQKIFFRHSLVNAVVRTVTSQGSLF